MAEIEHPDFVTRRLERNPITYTVTFHHTAQRFWIEVSDVSGDTQARLAVAGDLEHAAEMIRKEHEARNDEATDK